MKKASNIKRCKPNVLRHGYRDVWISVLLLFVLAIWPTTYMAQMSHDKRLSIWFFDVGQGDATFVQTPSGHQVLVDGGVDNSVLQKLGSVMLPWDRTIDAIVLTHPDTDHITGLVAVLQRYRVKTIYYTGASSFTPAVTALEQAMITESVPIRKIKAGDEISYGGVVFNVLWPEKIFTNDAPKDRNETSIVLEISFGDTSVLLTGDAGVGEEDRFLGKLNGIDVLKVGHHGSNTSTGNSLLQRIRPMYSIISSGIDNQYGHPHPVILTRLMQVNSEIYRTDVDGDILLLSDGGEPHVFSKPLPF